MAALASSSSSSSSLSSPSGSCSLKKLEMSQGSFIFFLLRLVSSLMGAVGPPGGSFKSVRSFGEMIVIISIFWI